MGIAVRKVVLVAVEGEVGGMEEGLDCDVAGYPEGVQLELGPGFEFGHKAADENTVIRWGLH